MWTDSFETLSLFHQGGTSARLHQKKTYLICIDNSWTESFKIYMFITGYEIVSLRFYYSVFPNHYYLAYKI